MTNSPLKIIGSVAAVVGAFAALALINGPYSSIPRGRVLLEDQDHKTTVLFNQFLSKHHKNYLTKSEYQARLELFKDAA